MQPSEITAHKVDRAGTKFRRGINEVSLHHFAIRADILVEPRLMSTRLSWGLRSRPAYGALKQFVGITFRIEPA